MDSLADGYYLGLDSPQMTGKTNRSIRPKGAGAVRGSRKRQRNRLVSASVVISISTLALLPILNQHRATPLDPPPVPPPTAALGMNGVDPGRKIYTASAASAAAAAVLAESSESGGSDGVERSTSPQQLNVVDYASWTQKSGGGVIGGVTSKGEGGKLKDGRDRCFTDLEGFHRCYPTVFFFGTSKCGTTSLARWLDHHPSTHWMANPRNVNNAQVGLKESHVFDDTLKGKRKLEQSILHEKLSITAPKTSADSVVIDYTPHYLAVAEAPYRIADMYGGRDSGLKFIVTLREPASRTISSWEFKNNYNSKRGRREESRSLADTVADGRRRAKKLDSCLSAAKIRAMDPRERDLILCNPRKILENPLYVSHVGKSMYAMQLERWFDLFGREKFKVVFMDDIADDPMGVIKDVLEFLGLDFTSEDESKGLPDIKRWKKVTGFAHNKTTAKKKNELSDQVTDQIRDDLRAFFKPHNEALEELLGDPLPHAWKQQPTLKKAV
ncbi:unnamed protein product [Pylaiella littoralis]